MMKNKIGFIGLGTMGGPMAANLLKAGYQVLVYDINPDLVEKLVQTGAESGDSFRNLCEQCDVLITMLPESSHVEEVVFGAGGILENIREDMLLVDMSSITPDTSIKVQEALFERGADALDAPVSGGPQGAEAGSLSIMTGGNDKAFEKGLPLLEVLGGKVMHMGKPGSGQLTKLCNQILIGIHLQAVSEAFALAKKSGLDVGKVREAMLGGVAASKVLEIHGQKIIDRTFDQPAFKLKLHRKDITAALSAGVSAKVPLYATMLVANQMDAAMAQGYGELDHTTIVLVEELLSYIKQG